MIVCAICGDQDGPWSYEEGIGFVCEDCLEKLAAAGEKDDKRELQMRRPDGAD